MIILPVGVPLCDDYTLLPADRGAYRSTRLVRVPPAQNPFSAAYMPRQGSLAVRSPGQLESAGGEIVVPFHQRHRHQRSLTTGMPTAHPSACVVAVIAVITFVGLTALCVGVRLQFKGPVSVQG